RYRLILMGNYLKNEPSAQEKRTFLKKQIEHLALSPLQKSHKLFHKSDSNHLLQLRACYSNSSLLSFVILGGCTMTTASSTRSFFVFTASTEIVTTSFILSTLITSN